MLTSGTQAVLFFLLAARTGIDPVQAPKFLYRFQESFFLFFLFIAHYTPT